jgi:enoyl-CoA hydratase
VSKENLVLIAREGKVGIVTLNRPEALNALSPEMLSSVCQGLEGLDQDDAIRAIILTGSQRAFAAGADIKVMAAASPMDMMRTNTKQYWERMRQISKPLIAAVSGYIFGGGCELAMHCDLIVASESARFAHPEIKLGIMPGAGGTQLITKAIGPYRAMEMILTGEPLSAQRAYEFGLVNRLVPVERYLDEAKELAQLIAERPPVAVRLARQAIRHGIENTFREGVELERRNFMLLFDTLDQDEGMKAFLEKREPNFKGE